MASSMFCMIQDVSHVLIWRMTFYVVVNSAASVISAAGDAAAGWCECLPSGERTSSVGWAD